MFTSGGLMLHENFTINLLAMIRLRSLNSLAVGEQDQSVSLRLDK